MIKKAIRNLHSDKDVQPRFCDVIIVNGQVFLEMKSNKKIVTILWEDMKYQVNAAIKKAANE